MERKTLEERMQLFLEKNVPTDSSKWAYWVGQAKRNLMFILLLMQTGGCPRCIKMKVVNGRPRRRNKFREKDS